MYKILIIEDDKHIAHEIADRLTSWGYFPKICDDLRHVDSFFIESGAHLLLLDIGLPYYNGFYWCQKIRAQSNVPIIFISSANDSLNIVTAINQGGDDFVEKPFDLNVLIAKVQAQLRRAYNLSVPSDIIFYGKYQLDSSHLKLICSNTSIDLTKNELKILQTLIHKKGQIISRSELMHALWDSDMFIDDNTLTVNITRLKKKMSDNEVEPFIKTKKGFGYYVE